MESRRQSLAPEGKTWQCERRRAVQGKIESYPRLSECVKSQDLGSACSKLRGPPPEDL